MRLNQFQSHPSSLPMIFDDSSDQCLDYHHSFDSPDLRPISLPMTGYEKSSLEGMINLQAAATAFPDSNAFGHYLPATYDPHFPNQHQNVSAAQDSEPEYPSDNDFGYPVEYVDRKDMYCAAPIAHTAAPVTINTGSQQGSRKRKASPSSDYAESKPQKKVTVSHLKIQDPQNEFYDVSRQPSPYAKYVPTNTTNVQYSGARVLNNSPRPGHHYSTSNASQVSLAAPSPHTPAWSPSFTTVKTEHSPRAPMTPAPRPASTSSPYIAQHPKLVRTSTISQQPSPGVNVSMGAGIHTHAFNPYAMYPHNKATLRLNGDLDSVPNKWTNEELEVRRKLIVFNRSQTGSTINADFKTVAPQDWSRSDITVNCIWWKEKAEAYVTSVDTIALLEQLIAVRFTVEEKNRIRRNLEGFRPLTVSKAKPDSEDFFKVIMGFPNPKPRNIEKDVKVFPWKILGHALKKIISKYSASYSSTASAMITPTNSAYASTESSSDYPYEVPQPQPLMSNAMPPCSMSMPYYDNSVVAGRMSAPNMVAVPEMPLQAQPVAIPYEMIQHGYVYGPMPMQMPMAHHQMQLTPHQVAPPHHMQPAWNFEQYNGDAQGRLSSSAPASAHPRVHMENAELVSPAAYQMLHR